MYFGAFWWILSALFQGGRCSSTRAPESAGAVLSLQYSVKVPLYQTRQRQRQKHATVAVESFTLIQMGPFIPRATATATKKMSCDSIFRLPREAFQKKCRSDKNVTSQSTAMLLGSKFKWKSKMKWFYNLYGFVARFVALGMNRKKCDKSQNPVEFVAVVVVSCSV